MERVAARSVRVGFVGGLLAAVVLAPVGMAAWPAEFYPRMEIGLGAVALSVLATCMVFIATGIAAARVGAGDRLDARAQGLMAGGIAGLIAGPAALTAPIAARAVTPALYAAAGPGSGEELLIGVLASSLGRLQLLPLATTLAIAITGAVLGSAGGRRLYRAREDGSPGPRIGVAVTAGASAIILPFGLFFLPSVGVTMWHLGDSIAHHLVSGKLALWPGVYGIVGVFTSIFITTLAVVLPLHHIFRAASGWRRWPLVSDDVQGQRIAWILPLFWLMPLLGAVPVYLLGVVDQVSDALGDGGPARLLRSFAWLGPVTVAVGAAAWTGWRRPLRSLSALPRATYTIDAALLGGVFLHAVVGWVLVAGLVTAKGLGPAATNIREGGAFGLQATVDELGHMLLLSQPGLLIALAVMPLLAFGWTGLVFLGGLSLLRSIRGESFTSEADED